MSTPKLNENMKVITINVPKPWIALMEVLIKAGLYPSRSELIRNSLNRMIYEELENLKNLQEFLEMPEIKQILETPIINPGSTNTQKLECNINPIIIKGEQIPACPKSDDPIPIHHRGAPKKSVKKPQLKNIYHPEMGNY